MPGLDGFELLRALRADDRTRTVPVILLSVRAQSRGILPARGILPGGSALPVARRSRRLTRRVGSPAFSLG
jgi:CheY-like chemotaxis protein